ncbi:hypothetical protein [Salipiger bermudensis]|uniref:hypothetical protein n=1 Tax=Salipiger bermudensis TaxID=344736 RepID=UPI001CD4E5C1|nr:hypothetical protein [Salipiger bermudensis]MCA1288679.1 hypothetical protein [Salipiger bermudensis]
MRYISDFIDWIEGYRGESVHIFFKVIIYAVGVAVLVSLAVAALILLLSIAGPVYLIIFAAIILFFSVAWIPFVMVLVFIGIFSHPKSVMTYRSKSALVAFSVFVILAQAYEVNIGETQFGKQLSFPRDVYSGYAAFLVALLYFGYLRFCYLDGVTSFRKGRADNGVSRGSGSVVALYMPSMVVISVLFDLFLPTVLAVSVLVESGCDALGVLKDLARQVDDKVHIAYATGEILDRLRAFDSFREFEAGFLEKVDRFRDFLIDRGGVFKEAAEWSFSDCGDPWQRSSDFLRWGGVELEFGWVYL